MAVMKVVEDAPASGGKPPVTPEPAGVRFKKNIFVTEEGTGLKVAAEGRNRGKRLEGTTPEYVEFKKPLVEQYRRFLDNYITNLVKLKDARDPNNPGKSLFDTVLQNPNHVADRQLLQLLGTDIRDTRGGHVETLVSEEKINKILQNPEGWTITTQLLERQTALKLFALGLHIEAIPPGERHALADPMRIRLNINRGILNKFGESVFGRLAPLLSRDLVDSMFVGGSLGVMVGSAVEPRGPWGMLAGMGAGAAVGPVVFGTLQTVRYLSREGVVLDLRQCSGTFRAINNDPTERAYVNAVMGINTQDFVETGTNQIGLRPGRAPETMRHAAYDLENEVLQGVYSRQEFYTSLGIPLVRLDALPEQFLYSVVDFQQEKTGARWEQRVEDKFKPNDIGVQDSHHRPMTDPLFDINDLDFEGNVRRYMDARREVLTEDLQDLVSRKLGRARTENSVTILEDRLKELKSGGGALKTKKETIEKRKASISGDKTALEGEKTSADTYKTNLAEFQLAKRNLQTELGSINSGGGAPFTDVDPAIRALRTLTRTGTNITVGTRIIQSFYDRNVDILGRKKNAITAIPARATGESATAYESRYKVERELVEAQFQGELDELTEDRTFIEATIHKLTQLNNEVTDKKNLLGEKSENVVKVKSIDSYNKDFAKITGWGISEADLRANDFNDLLISINAAWNLNHANGWPEEQNGRQDIRTSLSHAVIEAKARQVTPILVTPGPDFQALTNTAVWNISENQLRTLTVTEINDLITQRLAALAVAVGAPTTAQIQNGIREANARFDGRLNALSERIDFLAEQTTQEEARLSGVNLNREIENLNAVVDLLKRYGTIEELALNIPDRQTEYTDTTLVAATDRDYTETEIAANLPKGYYEMLDLMFDYKINPSRSNYFQTVSRILPPDRLATLLNDTLDLQPLGFAGPINITNALTWLETGMTNGKISSPELSTAFGTIVAQLREEGKAIAA